MILEADERMTESIKWKSPTFEYRGNLASIDPKAKKHVSVLFHTGASIPGEHPILEGGGDVARYIRFADRRGGRGRAAAAHRGRARLVRLAQLRSGGPRPRRGDQ